MQEADDDGVFVNDEEDCNGDGDSEWHMVVKMRQQRG